MNVIVCGAGQVGSNIARHLANENNQVTVIDQSPELVRKLTDSSDVAGVVGFASHPGVLERAGASEAELLIAVTYADEVNMVACQVAHSLFSVPTKIARVRAQGYLSAEWADLFSRDHMPIDVIISPEIEVARAMRHRLLAPGTFDMIPLANGRVRVIGIRVDEDCPIINTPLRQLTTLFPDLHMTVVSIIRGRTTIVPTGDDEMIPGDEVYFVVAGDHVARAMAAFGQEETPTHRIVIVGGGNIGLFLAQELEKNDPHVAAKIIEVRRDRAETVVQRVNKTVVVNGSALDLEILDEVNVQNADSIVAVTNDDEVNILSALLAKRAGCKRAIALVNNPTFEPLISTLGVDVVVNPRAITVSTILQHIRRGRIHSVHSLREGIGEVVEAEALDTSSVVGKEIRQVRGDKSIIIGALLRGADVVIPRGGTVIQSGDRVVLFAARDAVKTVEKIFAVRLEYF